MPSKPSPPSAVVDADVAGSSDTSPLQDYDGEGDDEVVTLLCVYALFWFLDAAMIKMCLTNFLYMFFAYLVYVWIKVCKLEFE